MALDATFRHRSFGVVLVQFEVETQSHRGHGVLLLAFPFEGCGQGWIHFRNLGWCPVASHDFSVTLCRCVSNLHLMVSLRHGGSLDIDYPMKPRLLRLKVEMLNGLRALGL